MNHSIIKQWMTVDGTYHSATVDKKDYDTAVGEYHSMFKPMQNDTNVAWFRLELIDENGFSKEHCRWVRPVPAEEPTE